MSSFAERAVLVVSDVPKHALELAQCARDDGALSVRVVHASQRKGEDWKLETLPNGPDDSSEAQVVLFRWTRDATSCLSCMGAVRSAKLAGCEAWFSGQLRLFGGGGGSSGKMKGLKDASQAAGFSQLHTLHLLTDHDTERTLCFK
jgi:hypothetical protein